MYYVACARLHDRPAVADISPAQAIGVSIALLAGGWMFYDQLCKRAGLDRETRSSRSSIVAFLALVAWGLSHLFSGRAVYLQVGAMIGTIMAANVCFVIIPAQRKLVEAKERGVAPDPVHGLRGKQRCVHNNYFTLPVLFIMISNHYPMTCGHPQAWLVLVAIMLLAAFVRHFFNLRHKGRTVWAIPVAAASGALVLAVAIAPRQPDAAGSAARSPRCRRSSRSAARRCHAAQPTQDGLRRRAEERHAATRRS